MAQGQKWEPAGWQISQASIYAILPFRHKNSEWYNEVQNNPSFSNPQGKFLTAYLTVEQCRPLENAEKYHHNNQNTDVFPDTCVQEF